MSREGREAGEGAGDFQFTFRSTIWDGAAPDALTVLLRGLRFLRATRSDSFSFNPAVSASL